MTSFAVLDIEFRSRTAAKAARDIEAVEKASDRVEKKTRLATDQIDRMERSMGGLGRATQIVSRALGAFGVAISAGAILRAGDQMTQWTNSLRLVAGEQQDVNRLLSQLNDVASRTRAPLDGIVTLYQRASMAGKELGATQKEMMRFTENVGLALAQQGGSAASASGALLQLSQALGGGVVRAEEFNSMMEGAYPLVMAAAQGIDGAAGSVARLRNMVNEGEVTSKEFFDAILSQSDALEKAFGSTVPTIGQAFSVLTNNATMFLGQMDQMTGATSGISRVILLLANNLSTLAGIGIAGATAAAIAYAPAIYGAVTATYAWVASLVTLKGAIAATGIGVLVLGAGYLIGKLIDMVQAVGGVGEAFRLLGAIGSEVAERIGRGFVHAGDMIGGAAGYIQGMFLGAFATIARGFAALMTSIAQGLAAIGIGDGVGVGTNFAADITAQSDALIDSGYARVKNATNSLKNLASAPLASMDALRTKMDEAASSSAGAADAIGGMGSSLDALGGGKGGGKAGKAKKAVDELAQAADRWKDRLKDARPPLEKYNADLEELTRLHKAGKLSADELAGAQKLVTNELAESTPLVGDLSSAWGDFVTTGLRDFKGFVSNVLGSFKRMFSEMIAMSSRNKIMISMGMGSGGVAGAAGAVTGIGGAGGVLGGAMSGLGALGGAFMSGMGGFATALGGGLGSAATYTSFMLKGATTSLAGFGSALGAIALPIAAVTAVFSFFRKKVKELDSGIRVTVDGMETLVEEFRKTETKRFWGLSKKTRTSYDEADQETQDAISRVVGTLQKGVMDAAKVLGFGAATFRDFAHEMKVSTKGMSEDEALKAVQDAIAGLGDDFAGMVPGLNRMRKDGEGASDALLRLSQSLVTVNGIMDTLGHRFRAAGLSGADAASKIADAFGGLDAMAQVTQRFYEAFYSDAERLATTTRQTAKAMADLGIAMPRTRNEYRAIISALDLTTEKGRKTYAALIGMTDAFDLILPQIGSFTKEMEKLQGRVTNALDSVIDKLGNAIKWNAAAAADWRKAGTSIREYLDKLRGTASALFNPLQARAANQALYNRTLRQAMGGNVEAAGNLPGAAQNYLGSVTETARTREEAALAQARVAVELGKVATKTDTTAAALEKVAELQQKQLDLLTAARDFIADGNTLTKEGITKLLGQLGGLDAKIALRAKDAGTIVAGFNDSLKGTKVQTTLTGAEGLQSAMGTLRGALVDLRAAIAAETKRQQDAVKKAAEAVNKPPATPKPTTPAKPAPAKPKAYTLADYKLIGGHGTGGSEGNGMVYTVRGPLGGIRTFSDPMGYTSWQEFIKRQNFPAFATGGTHRGGPAYIAETGPELVMPSRIHNPRETRAMLDQRETVAELRALRDEMRELVAHARRTSDSTVQAQKTLQKIDALGVKIDPDQNKVTA